MHSLKCGYIVFVFSLWGNSDEGMGKYRSSQCARRSSIVSRASDVGNNLPSHSEKIFWDLFLHSSSLHHLHALLRPSCWHLFHLLCTSEFFPLHGWSVLEVLAISPKCSSTVRPNPPLSNCWAQFFQDSRYKNKYWLPNFSQSYILYVHILSFQHSSEHTRSSIANPINFTFAFDFNLIKMNFIWFFVLCHM